MVDAIFVYSPEKELQVLADLVREKKELDWKPAIILSATYLEKAGIRKLQGYFKRKSERARKKKDKAIELNRRFEGLSLPNVAILLYGLGLIKPKSFTHITQIWRTRTDIVHSKDPPRAYFGKEANERYGRMVSQALEIIQFLDACMSG